MKTKTVNPGSISVSIRFFAILSILLGPMGCDKETDAPVPPVTITAISPASGAVGSPVTITGKGFGEDIDAVRVFFNGTTAKVNSATDQGIIAEVPSGATTGNVRVVKGGEEAEGPIFTVIATAKEGQVTTLAGSTRGYADGSGQEAKFGAPTDVAVDAQGNVYVADEENHRIRKITPTGEVTTIAGSIKGFADGTGADAYFDFPRGIALDGKGNIYVADQGNHSIRKITATGVVSTIAGGTAGYKDGPGAEARFDFPFDVAVDDQGFLYVADAGNDRIRRITPEGLVGTLAGSAEGFADGEGENARFDTPRSVAMDLNGNILVSDDSNRLRQVTPAGMVSTLAGSTLGFGDGAGAEAKLHTPIGLAVDSGGNIYLADFGNHRIRKVSPSGSVTTLAGTGQGLKDGNISESKFDFPYGVAVDEQGNVYVADRDNHRIRKVVPE